MQRIFVPIYRYFKSHKVLLYLVLGISTLIFVFFGSKLRYEEDVAKLLPRSSVESELAFSDIGLKDKIFIQITSASPDDTLDTWTLSGYIDEFTAALQQRDSSGKYIRGILSTLEVETALGAMDYGFEHLPSLIDTSFYKAFAQALTPEAIESRMVKNVELIESDMTGETTQMVCTDPFALRDIILAQLMPEGAEDGSVGDYTIENGHFFCPDRSVAMAFLSPSFQQTDSGTSTRFAKILNQERKIFEAAHPDARILFHGAPLGAVSGAGAVPVLPGPVASAVLPGRSGGGFCGFLDGKIDLSGRVDGNDLDLDLLAHGKVLIDIADVGMRDLRNMYESGPPLRQRNKRAEIGDGLDLAFQNLPSGELHICAMSSLRGCQLPAS